MTMIKFSLLLLLLISFIEIKAQNDDLYYRPSKTRTTNKDSLAIQESNLKRTRDSLIAQRKKSIHFFPNAIDNFYVLNFEYLYKDNKSLLIEGQYWFGEDNFSRYEFLLNYRIHSKPSLNSWFYGPFMKLTQASMDIYYLDITSLELYPVDWEYMKFSLGVNGGRKWVFGNGIGIELRLGWGIPFLNVKENGIKVTRESIFFEGIESSLTFGYSF